METPNRDALERVGDRPFLFSFAKSGKSGVGEEPEESLSAAAAALREGTDSEGEEGAEPGGANLGEANKLGHSSHKLALALRGGRHGKPLSLNHPELCVEVKLKTNKKHEKARERRTNLVSVYVTVGVDRLRLTKMVWLRNSITVHNATGSELHVMLCDNEHHQPLADCHAIRVPACACADGRSPCRRGRCPFVWPEHMHQQRVVRLQLVDRDRGLRAGGVREECEPWSAAVRLDVPGEQWVRSSAAHTARLLSVEVTQLPGGGGCLLFTVREESTAPYRIANHLPNQVVRLRQELRRSKQFAKQHEKLRAELAELRMWELVKRARRVCDEALVDEAERDGGSAERRHARLEQLVMDREMAAEGAPETWQLLQPGHEKQYTWEEPLMEDGSAPRLELAVSLDGGISFSPPTSLTLDKLGQPQRAASRDSSKKSSPQTRLYRSTSPAVSSEVGHNPYPQVY